MRLTSGQNAIDPVTGLTVVLGQVRILMDGSIRVTQTTGEAPMGLNELPGTDANFPGSDTPVTRGTGDDDTRVTEDAVTRVTGQTYNPDIGLPYGFVDVPDTGPLV